VRAPSARPAPEIQATRPQPTESGTKSAKPKAKRTRKTQTGGEKPNLDEKLRDLLGKKRDQAENQSRRTRVLAAAPHGAARSVGAEHERKRSAGAGPKSELPEGLKCKISGRRKMEMGEKRGAGGGRAGFYRRGGAGRVRCDAAAWGRFCGGGPGVSEYLHTDRSRSGRQRSAGGEPAANRLRRVQNDLLCGGRWLAVFVFGDRHGQVWFVYRFN
jgi:hypothetical protein